MEMKKIEYMKIPVSVVRYSNNTNNSRFLNVYLYLRMMSNPDGNIHLSIDTISKTLEFTNDTRLLKIEEYQKVFEAMSNDIIDENGNVILSQILSYNILLRYKKDKKDENNSKEKNLLEMDTKNVLNIYLSTINEEISNNYMRLYFDEYRYLFTICQNYAATQKKKLNMHTLVSLYMNVKYLINIHDTFSKSINTKTEISTTQLSKKLNVAKRTINSYLNILEQNKMIDAEKSNYDPETKQYSSNKFALNDAWKAPKIEKNVSGCKTTA